MRDRLRTRLTKLNDQRKASQEASQETDAVIQLVKDFINFKSINKSILSKLIDRIEIFEGKKIAVHYKFRKPDIRYGDTP